MPVWPCAPRRVRRSFITRRHAAFQQEFQPMAVVSPTLCSVKQALSGKLDAGSAVTVRGWVRTRRDSKAGLSFVNVTDGSCFDPIQAVVPATLGNYASEVLHLTAGASVIVSGTLVASQGKGQAFEQIGRAHV